MSKRTFDKIAEGLREAIEVARSNAAPARLHVPPEFDVRAVRRKTGLSQDGFATSFGFTVHQLRQWEQGRHRPTGGMRAYLTTIDRDHAAILNLLKQASAAARAA